jgi:hypothetical protein
MSGVGFEYRLRVVSRVGCWTHIHSLWNAVFSPPSDLVTNGLPESALTLLRNLNPPSLDSTTVMDPNTILALNEMILGEDGQGRANA